MMKKMCFVIFLVCAACFCKGELANCNPKTYGNGSLPCTVGGLIYSNSIRAMYSSPRVDLRNFIVLGKVEGRTSMKNVLFLFNFGDTGFQAMKRDALKNYPDADDIVNFDIDARQFNILIFFFETEAIIRGVAVKYRTSVPAAK